MCTIVEDSGGLCTIVEDCGGLCTIVEDCVRLCTIVEDCGGLWRIVEDWGVLMMLCTRSSRDVILSSLHTYVHISITFSLQSEIHLELHKGD